MTINDIVSSIAMEYMAKPMNTQTIYEMESELNRLFFAHCKLNYDSDKIVTKYIAINGFSVNGQRENIVITPKLQFRNVYNRNGLDGCVSRAVLFRYAGWAVPKLLNMNTEKLNVVCQCGKLYFRA